MFSRLFLVSAAVAFLLESSPSLYDLSFAHLGDGFHPSSQASTAFHHHHHHHPHARKELEEWRLSFAPPYLAQSFLTLTPKIQTAFVLFQFVKY